MTTSKKRIRAYGITHAELAELQEQQIQGSVPLIPANNCSPEDFTDEFFREKYTDYQIPAHNKMHYHVVMEPRLFHPGTGEKTSTPVTQCMDDKTFKFMNANKGFYGKVVHVLHDPNKQKGVAKIDGAMPGSRRKKSAGNIGTLLTLKDAKTYYETLTGEPANQFWNLKRTIDEIKAAKAGLESVMDGATDKTDQGGKETPGNKKDGPFGPELDDDGNLK